MNSSKQILLAKLRRPIHISFISNHIVKLPMNETIELIKEMIEDDLIEESEYGKGYYVIKKQK